jgi:hypothetical protein
LPYKQTIKYNNKKSFGNHSNEGKKMETQTVQILERKPIISTLKGLEIGESTDFPIAQIQSIETSFQRLRNLFGLKFSRTVPKDYSRVTVTRVA